MRTHSEIVRSIDPLAPFARRRGVSIHTARSWIQRNRIPAEHWKAIADERIASLEELAEGAAAPIASAIREPSTKWGAFPMLEKSASGGVVTSELVRRLEDEGR